MIKHVFVSVLCLLTLVNCGGGNPTVDPAPTPETNNTVWLEASPESQGFDATALAAAFDAAFMDGHYTQAGVVIVNDRLIYERYRGIGTLETEALESAGWGQLVALYRARDRDSLANSWSMAKSVTSLLVGIAIDRGEIESLDESASNYIPAWANDARKDISIANLLDMRSGLEPMCIDFFSGDLQPCTSAKDAEAGGNIYYADDQLSACLARSLDLAEPGIAAWANLKVGSFLYSNCDSMALAEILFQATGKDLQDYADRYLFSPLNITALWWRDNVEVGQRAGNYLGYCCLDARPRDFAKLGQLLLNDGGWNGEQVVSKSYVEAIKKIATDSIVQREPPIDAYGLQFRTLSPQAIDSQMPAFPTAFSTYAAAGFDHQYILIDFDKSLVVARNSLYAPLLFAERDGVDNDSERKMHLDIELATGRPNIANTSFTATLPEGAELPVTNGFSIQQFLYDIVEAGK